MARAKTAYVCSECGASALQWFGACPSCGAAGTLSETLAERPSAHRYAARSGPQSPVHTRIGAKISSQAIVFTIIH